MALSKDDKEFLKEQEAKFQNMDKEDLMEELLRARRGQRSDEFRKKNDQDLQELSKTIKSFIANNTPDEIKRMKIAIKQFQKEIKNDDQIKDAVLDKKMKSEEYNNPISIAKKEQEMILKILSEKGLK